jgi:hypothetical protein
MPTDDGLNGSGTDTQPMPAIIRIGWRAENSASDARATDEFSDCDGRHPDATGR